MQPQGDSEMTEQEKQALLRKVAAENPLAAQLMQIAQDGMIALAEALTEDGGAVEINGKKVTQEDARRAREAFGPSIIDDQQG